MAGLVIQSDQMEFYTMREEAESAAKDRLPKNFPEISGPQVYVVKATKFVTEQIEALSKATAPIADARGGVRGEGTACL